MNLQAVEFVKVGSRDARTGGSIAPIRGVRRQRDGYSLIELLLVVAVVSLVLSLVAVSMHVLFNVDRQLKNDSAYGQIVPRLSLQLRTDAHAARTARVLADSDVEAGVLFTTAIEAEVIEYQSSPGRVIRTRRSGQAVLGREVYLLGKQATSQWRITPSPAQLVELEIVRPRGKIASADARQVDRVVAAVGIRASPQAAGAADAPGR